MPRRYFTISPLTKTVTRGKPRYHRHLTPPRTTSRDLHHHRSISHGRRSVSILRKPRCRFSICVLWMSACPLSRTGLGVGITQNHPELREIYVQAEVRRKDPTLWFVRVIKLPTGTLLSSDITNLFGSLPRLGVVMRFHPRNTLSSSVTIDLGPRFRYGSDTGRVSHLGRPQLTPLVVETMDKDKNERWTT
jgi:hypothetical protein